MPDRRESVIDVVKNYVRLHAKQIVGEQTTETLSENMLDAITTDIVEALAESLIADPYFEHLVNGGDVNDRHGGLNAQNVVDALYAESKRLTPNTPAGQRVFHLANNARITFEALNRYRRPPDG